MSEEINDLVVATLDLYKENGAVIPAGTLGVICGRTGYGLIQVNFGPHYGVKFVPPHTVDVVGRAAEPEDLGTTLADMVLKLSDEANALKGEVVRLKSIIAQRAHLAPSRLVMNGGSTYVRTDIGDGSR